MLDYKRLDNERREAYCYEHWHYPQRVEFGIEYCSNCGAILGPTEELIRQAGIWLRVRKALGKGG